MHFKIMTNTTWFNNDCVFVPTNQLKLLSQEEVDSLKSSEKWVDGCGDTKGARG